jgi:hypothetical protein
MEILAQFLLRLAFGLALGMAITSPQKVSSGFFRNHLYVTLGLTTLAAILLDSPYRVVRGLALAAILLSWLGVALYFAEAKRAGRIMLWIIAISSLGAAILGQRTYGLPDWFLVLRSVAVFTSGLVLGLTFAAMLLGHWYLNSPGMELAPLYKLLNAAMVAVCLQAIVSGVGLAGEFSSRSDVSFDWLLFVLLRWSFGLLGVFALLWMARQTLKIPNTQSATGILYVAVIGVFVGELTAALLSSESMFPL